MCALSSMSFMANAFAVSKLNAHTQTNKQIKDDDDDEKELVKCKRHANLVQYLVDTALENSICICNDGRMQFIRCFCNNNLTAIRNTVNNCVDIAAPSYGLLTFYILS